MIVNTDVKCKCPKCNHEFIEQDVEVEVESRDFEHSYNEGYD